jgi:hypothetical protein
MLDIVDVESSSLTSVVSELDIGTGKIFKGYKCAIH